MAVEDFSAVGKPGITAFMVFWKLRDGFVWDSLDSTFKAIGDATSPALGATEYPQMGGPGRSLYVVTIDVSTIHAGASQAFWVESYRQASGGPVLATDKVFAELAFCIEHGKTKLTEQDVIDAVENVVNCTGSGDIPVDEDFGGDNALCYIIDGKPVDNAVIQAFLKTDYVAGNRGNEFVQGLTRTTVDGSWLQDLMLDAGVYIIQFHKQGFFGPDIIEITVTV